MRGEALVPSLCSHSISRCNSDLVSIWELATRLCQGTPRIFPHVTALSPCDRWSIDDQSAGADPDVYVRTLPLMIVSAL
jgi:hypothetical protein